MFESRTNNFDFFMCFRDLFLYIMIFGNGQLESLRATVSVRQNPYISPRVRL